ncbi:MAG: helix-turn-helix domain-containing protein [Planctomycetes bacterium]|nr:helix-turn-helix domain-containing protein [Planctomycetota bacterium]
MTTEPEPLMTAQEVADLLHVSLRTCRTLLASGAIPSIKVAARARRIDVNDLDAYVASRKDGGTR